MPVAQVTDTLVDHALDRRFLQQWWEHHSRPPKWASAVKQLQLEQLRQQHDVVAGLWPWGAACHQPGSARVASALMEAGISSLQGPGSPGQAAAETDSDDVHARQAAADAQTEDRCSSSSSFVAAASPHEEPRLILRFASLPVPPLAQLDVQLRTALRLLPAALAEPTCLRGPGGAFDSNWGDLLKAAQQLVTR